MPGQTVIEARGLTRRYGRGDGARTALNDVSFSVESGEVVLIFGPSGSGKSTLLSVLGGLDRGYSGGLSLFGTDIGALSDSELARLRGRHIGFIFQAFHLLPHLSVLDNVLVPSLFAPEGATGDVRRRALAALERVELADRAAALPDELSGGQRQRVAIARALLREPRLLLCDEPTGNLDRRTGERIIDLFADLHERLGSTIVVVTHEARIGRIADRTVHIVDGRIERDEQHDRTAVRNRESTPSTPPGELADPDAPVNARAVEDSS